MSSNDWAADGFRGLVQALEAVYGRPRQEKPSEPLGELVSCVLSQNTTDANSQPAYRALRERFTTWDALVGADPEAIEDTIRPAGLARQKTATILACMRAVKDRFGRHDLSGLSDLSTEEARTWLESIPGVGPKTAAIVLCFSLGRDVVPVDTHVHRAALRLGLLPAKTTAVRAHRLLAQAVAPGLAYRAHMALIRHGRRTCRARKPACGRCPVKADCPWPAKEADA
jgi:endonuclease III